MDKWINGQMDKWTKWINGPLDKWTFVHLFFCPIVQSKRTNGQMNKITKEQNDKGAKGKKTTKRERTNG
jgi:hypothetical protein